LPPPLPILLPPPPAPLVPPPPPLPFANAPAPVEVPVIPEAESLGLVLCGLVMLLCLARFRRRC